MPVGYNRIVRGRRPLPVSGNPMVVVTSTKFDSTTTRFDSSTIKFDRTT